MLRNHPIFVRLSLRIIDILAICLSFYVSFQLRFYSIQGTQAGFPSIFNFFEVLMLVSIIYWLLFTFFESKHSNFIFKRYKDFWYEVSYILKVSVLGNIFLFALLYIVKIQDVPRTWIALNTVTNFITLSLTHYLQYLILSFLRGSGRNLRNVVIIGAGKKAKRYVEEVSSEESWGINIIGFLEKDESRIGTEYLGKLILDHSKNLKEILHKYQIDEVIFAVTTDSISEISHLMEACEEEGTKFKLISDFFTHLKSRIEVMMINEIPVISFRRNTYSEEMLILKRIFDIFLSGALLILLAPFLITIIFLIKITSPGPIFYVWKVVGNNKKNFIGYKFRTMVINSDEIKKKLLKQNEMSGPVFKLTNDPRITPIGKFLRKYSLDELPQLWSVFKGDMSLVGPRPPLQSEVENFEHWHRRKLSFKPGLTCLWQVKGRSEITDFNDWVKLDLEYIDNWSLWLDLKILLMTIPVVIFGKGAK